MYTVLLAAVFVLCFARAAHFDEIARAPPNRRRKGACTGVHLGIKALAAHSVMK